MKSSISTTIILLCCAALFVQCQDENKAQMQQLKGIWTVTSAERNDTETDALNGVYFQFNDNQQVKTNFNMEASDETAPYSVNNNAISINAKTPCKLIIETLDNNNLEMKSEMQGVNFMLYCKKK